MPGSVQKQFEPLLEEYRLAAAEMVRALPAAARNAAALSDSLGLSRKLGWQVWRIANADSGWKAVDHMLTAAGCEAVAHAARSTGVSAEVVRAFEQVDEKIREAARRHCTDPAMLPALLRGAGPDEIALIDASTRRETYRASRRIWGVSIDTVFATDIDQPGSEPDRIDSIGLRGYVGIQRLRPSARCVFAATGHRNQRDLSALSPTWSALEPLEGDRRELEPIMLRFSSEPVPVLGRADDLSGQARLELAPGPIGATGVATYVTGQVFRNFGYRRGTPAHHATHFSGHVEWPTRVFYRDFLVHRELWRGPLSTRVKVYGEIGGQVLDQVRRREEDRLPMRVDVEEFDAIDGRLEMPEFARYRELLEHSMRLLDWRAERYRAYRVRVEYPVLPSSIVFTVERAIEPPLAPESSGAIL